MLIDEKQLAELVGYSVRTVQGWRQKDIGPKYIRIHGKKSVRYRPQDVEDWINSHV